MNALVTIETLTAVQVFVDGNVEEIVARLETEIRSRPAPDMTIKDDREATRSLAAKISRSKTGLDDLGKEFVSDLKLQTGKVDAKRKLIRDRLDALRDEVRAPLTAYEEAEANRIAMHERELVSILEAGNTGGVSIEHLKARLAYVADRKTWSWEEFQERAEEACTSSVEKIAVAIAAAEQAERDQAELAELRRQKAERDEADRLEASRKAQEARDAEAVAEAARRETERQAQAVRDAEAAATKAVEDERKRVAKLEADQAAAAAKLERNRKHRTRIHGEAAEAIVAVILAQSNAAAGHLADAIVKAIAAGDIRHLTITY